MDGGHGSNHFENTIRAVREKKPIPEIDFTLHTMEDGTQVSTQERVCKGIEYLAMICRPARLTFVATHRSTGSSIHPSFR